MSSPAHCLPLTLVPDNAINGKPSCANDWLLDYAARQEWGFDGYGIYSSIILIILINLFEHSFE